MLCSIGLITWEEIVDLVYTGETSCHCGKMVPFDFYTKDHEKFNNRFCRICDFNKSLNIQCFFRLGLVTPEKENLEYLRDLVKCRLFSGAMMGKNKAALFMIGIQGERFIYLDPHFVQDAEDNDLEKYFQSYNCMNFRTIHQSKINPSLGISFTVKSFQDCLYL